LNAWIFSFECSGIVKVGGLAEVAKNHLVNLASLGVAATLIMPSHGRLSGARLLGMLEDGVKVYEKWVGNGRVVLLSSSVLDNPIIYGGGRDGS